MLFTGFMLTADGPKVLEYNVRFGDPETQALMLLLDDKTDLAEVMLVSSQSLARVWSGFPRLVLVLLLFPRLALVLLLVLVLVLVLVLMAQACVERRLDSVELGYREGYAVSVVLASGGYPGKYPKGVPMTINPSMPQGESQLRVTQARLEAVFLPCVGSRR